MPATDSMLRQTFPKLVIAPHASDEALSLGPSNGFGKNSSGRAFHARLSMGAVRLRSCRTGRSDHIACGKAAGLRQNRWLVPGLWGIGPRALGNRSFSWIPADRMGLDPTNGRHGLDPTKRHGLRLNTGTR